MACPLAGTEFADRMPSRLSCDLISIHAMDDYGLNFAAKVKLSLMSMSAIGCHLVATESPAGFVRIETYAT